MLELIRRIYASYLQRLDDYAMPNPYTWVYGLGRTVLAIGGLITFLFSSTQVLFDHTLFGKLSFDSVFDKINLFYLFGYANLPYVRGLVILVLLAVVSGYRPRLTGVLHWWVMFSFQQAASVLEGGDQVVSILTLLLIPITLLDNRPNHWAPARPRQSLYRSFAGNVFFTLIALQMSAVYFHAAVEKMYRSLEWRNGTALYYFSKDASFGSPPWFAPLYDWLLQLPLVVSTLTWSVMLFELLLFGALFMSESRRKLMLPLGIIFHLFIAIQFGLVSFFFSMTGGLILYLLPRATPLPRWLFNLRSSVTRSVLPVRVQAQKVT